MRMINMANMYSFHWPGIPWKGGFHGSTSGNHPVTVILFHYASCILWNVLLCTFNAPMTHNMYVIPNVMVVN